MFESKSRQQLHQIIEYENIIQAIEVCIEREMIYIFSMLYIYYSKSCGLINTFMQIPRSHTHTHDHSSNTRRSVRYVSA